MEASIPQRFEALTPDFLTGLLRRSGALAGGRVTARTVEPIGEGVGFVGALGRIRLEYDPGGDRGPDRVIAKLPGRIRLNRALVELGQGHEREVRFYRELAERARIGLPTVHAAEYDRDPREAARAADRARIEQLPLWLIRCVLPLALWRAGRSRRRYLLVLEDLAQRAETRDQVAGCSFDDARAVASALAALHAGFWNDAALARTEWIPHPDATPRSARAVYPSGRRRFAAEFGDVLPRQFMLATDWVDTHLEAVLARLSRPPCTLLHGDCRLDNLLFDGDRVTAIDWQSLAWGRGVLDWAYFATGSLASSIDEAGEQTLLAAYHAALVEGGVDDYPLDACRRDYALSKVLIAYGNVAATRFLDLEGERGRALIDAIRTRVVDRTPSPPWAWLL